MIKNIVLIATIHLIFNATLNAEIDANTLKRRDTSFDMKLQQNISLAKDDKAFDVKSDAMHYSSSKGMTKKSFDLTSKKQFARAK